MRAQYPLEGPKKLVMRSSSGRGAHRPAQWRLSKTQRPGCQAPARGHPVPMSQLFAEVSEPNDPVTVDRKAGSGPAIIKRELLTVMDSASRYCCITVT